MSFLLQDDDYTPGPELFAAGQPSDDEIEPEGDRRKKRKRALSIDLNQSGFSRKKVKGPTNRRRESSPNTNHESLDVRREVVKGPTNRRRESSSRTNRESLDIRRDVVKGPTNRRRESSHRTNHESLDIRRDSAEDLYLGGNEYEPESDDEGKVFATTFQELCKEFCKICQRDFTYMYDHVYRVHELTLNQYRREHGGVIYTHLTYHR